VMDQDQKDIDGMEIEISDNNIKNTSTICSSTLPSFTTKYSLSLPPSTASLFSNLLLSNPAYRQSVLHYWSCLSNDKSTLLSIYLTNTTTVYLDYTGCYLAQTVILGMIELEDALHWLSTLGGAFSNLGEHNPKFAMKAGTNAMKQLMVAIKCGDLTVIMKCWLFMGQSLLQQGQFSKASRVVRMVWKVCHMPPLALLSCTIKLLNMCRGVWARLRHERHKSMVQCLEVEQKFSVPDTYRTVLESAGAEKVSQKVLSDIYLDTHDLALLRQDVWLRKRGTQWELKIPAGVGGKNIGGMTQYVEVEGRDEVKRELARFTGIEMERMVEMVKVVSVRESWSLEEFSIVIDRMEDDGWSVGEVELIVKSKEEVKTAKTKVQDAVTMLGFTPQGYGKVYHCLGIQNPKAAAVLMELRRSAAGAGDGMHPVVTK